MALATCIVLGAAPAAFAQAPPRSSLTLSPSVARGIAGPHLKVGPFAIRNGTARAYALRVTPVLLGQRREGGLFVRLDDASRRRARALVRPTAKGGPFPPGASAGAAGLVRRIPRSRSLYGGLLFEATPRGPHPPGEQIDAVLRLNARILLDPPARLRRVRFATEPIRVDQAAKRRLTVRVPVANRGNAFIKAGGVVSIRDSRGLTVLRTRLRRFELLPGATVELTSNVRRQLPPGDYTLAASLRAGGKRFAASGSMRLVDVNEVAAAGGQLASFAPPKAYKGQAGPVEATFRNTGNVPFVPQASFELRSTVGGNAGKVLAKVPGRVEPAAPGGTAAIRGRVEVPESSTPLELTVRLAHDGRVLDERTVSVTPTARPSGLRRAAEFVEEHALALLGVAALMLAALLLGGVRYVRRLKAAAEPALRKVGDRPAGTSELDGAGREGERDRVPTGPHP